jgi:uncharacterized protein (DUF1800 family)
VTPRRLMIAALALLPVAGVQAAPLERDDMNWLARVGFGADSQTLATYQREGRQAFLEEQLRGSDTTLPPAIDAFVRSLTVAKTPVQALALQFRDAQQVIRAMPDGPAQVQARKDLRQRGQVLEQETQATILLREVYGRDQLREQLTWFWLNHFSVFGDKARVRMFVGDYADRVIGPHALGKFRDLVMASLTSPAMLDYLDNSKNAKGHVNENYARELMELHTLGVDGGYTQADVQQMALVLTGVGVKLDDTARKLPPRLLPYYRYENLFEFNPARHDFSDKVLMGRTIKGSGFDEVEHAVTQLTRTPACAKFITRKLAVYFAGDNPPPALLNRLTDTFLRTDGDIAQVMRTLLTAPELAAMPPAKFKDPNRFIASALRLTLDGKPVVNPMPMLRWAQQMAQPTFGRLTPDGWPLDGSAWSSSGQLSRRFEIARAIGSGAPALFAPEPLPGDKTPPPRVAPPDLQHSPLVATTLMPWLSDATRSTLAQAKSPVEWNTFLLSSPEFNQR